MINISTIVEHQFPDIYEDDGENLIAFIQAFYEFREENQFSPVDLIDLHDIDSTVDDFVTHFKQKYISGIPSNSIGNLRMFIKHCNDFYNSKGTENSIKLLFRLIFNVEAEIYYPFNDTFIPSSGNWVVPTYLEVSLSDVTKTYVGEQITGSVSKATAIVESVVRKKAVGRYYDVIYLSQLRGHFQAGEAIVNNTGVLQDAPLLVGSLNQIAITAGGSNNSLGDVFNVISDTGTAGLARVSGIVDGARTVSFSLIDSGSVYTANSLSYMSNTTLNFVSPAGSAFNVYENVKQQLFTVAYTAANNSWTAGDFVTAYTSGTWVVQATGRIVDNTGIAGANGNLTVAGFTGNFRLGDTIRKTGNTITAAIGAVTDTSATGFIMGANSSAIGLANTTNTFRIIAGALAQVVGQTTGAVANIVSIGTGSGATYKIGSLTNDETVYLNTDLLSGLTTAGVPVVYVGGDGSGSGIGGIGSISVVAGGTGYANGASVTFIGGNNTLSSISISAGGTGYANGDNLVSSAGIGLLSFVTTNGSGTITGITTVDPGKYYNFIPTITVTTSGGTGASLTAVLNNSSNTATGTLTTNTTGGIVSVSSTTGSSYYSTPLVTAPTGSGANLVALMNFGYGFSKFPTGNSTTSTLQDMFTFVPKSIGTIISLNGIAPGSGYNYSPFAQSFEPLITGYENKEASLLQTSTVGSFQVGELVTAPYSFPITTTTFTGITGNTAFEVGEFISQNSNTATGQVYYRDATTVQIQSVTGTFVVTSNSVTKIVGTTSGASANVTVSANSNVSLTAKGLVTGNDGTYLRVRSRTVRPGPNMQGTSDLVIGSVVTGQITNAMTTIGGISFDATTHDQGNNAIVSAMSLVANGIVTAVDVIDSGFAYQDQQSLTLLDPLNSQTISGTASLIREGTGTGFHKTTTSFASAGQHIQDSFYYQQYSYEVRSSKPLEEYATILKNMVHVAGTKMFGKTLINPLVDATVAVTSTSIS
jgi:hypothetical protein